jgi:nucleoid DNA-binding protein
MEQYLLELIQNNNRVIVPNFGAFIVSRDAGTTVLFNNFLSFNDGLLINHLSDREEIDTTEATRRVSEFVEKVKQELDDNGEYAIEKLGRFTKDQNGILRFTQDPHVSDLIPEKPAEDKKEEASEDSNLLDLDSEEQTEAAPSPEKKTEKPKAPEPPKPKSSPSAEKKAASTQAEKQSTQKQTEKSSAAKASQAKSQAKGQSATKKNTGAQKPPPPPKDKEKGGGLPSWVIALIILVPIVIILLYFLVWRGDNGQPKTVEEQPKVTDTIQEKTTIDSAAIRQAQKEEEERLKQEKEKEEKARQEKQQAQQGPRHHIIVGSFEQEANATQLVEKLKAEGFDSATSFTRNNLTVVSAASFKTLSEARDAQQKILQEQRMENWIVTRR